MNKLIFFFIMAWSLTGSAAYLDRVKERLFVIGNSCNDLTVLSSALIKWGERLGQFSDSRSECFCEDGKCRVEVTENAPVFLKKIYGRFPVNSGPNCWNSALRGAGIALDNHFVHPDEIGLWMSSPLCHELNRNEKLEPGDIIAIRKLGQEVHSFTYLTPDLGFNKSGYLTTSEYSISYSSSVIVHYGVEDRNCIGVKAKSNPDCKAEANYYRCGTLNEYLSTQSDIPKDFLMAFEELREVEKRISEAALNGRDSEFRNDSPQIKSYLNDLQTLAQSKESDYWGWKAISLRCTSLLIQTGYISQ